MRVIDAVWEKRNLGVETKEIEFEENDVIEAAEECLRKTHAEYLVAKVPANRRDISHLLHLYQYEFAEEMMLLSSSHLENIIDTGVMQRLYRMVSVKKADEEDVREVIGEIRKGMFSTDRISLDPFFPEGIAEERYANWMLDELNRGTELYLYSYKDKNIGFSALREIKDGAYISFLGGIYNETRIGGVGVVTAVKGGEIVKKLGGKSLSSMVSSNNITQIRNLIHIGYNVSKINDVFIKHENAE